MINLLTQQTPSRSTYAGAIQSFLLAMSSNWDPPRKLRKTVRSKGLDSKAWSPRRRNPLPNTEFDIKIQHVLLSPAKTALSISARWMYVFFLRSKHNQLDNGHINICIWSNYSLSLSISCSESYFHCTAHLFSYLIIYCTTCILAPICEMDSIETHPWGWKQNLKIMTPQTSLLLQGIMFRSQIKLWDPAISHPNAIRNTT